MVLPPRKPKPLFGSRAAVSVFSAAMLLGIAAGRARADVPVDTARSEGLPRKVLIGTVICGDEVYSTPLEERLRKMNEIVDAIAAEAQAHHAGKRLDLVVLPEALIARTGDNMAKRSVRLAEVQDAVGACARGHGCYLVAPMNLQETDRCSNAAVLFDRTGKVVGMYRKVHPVADQGSDVIESGTTPGSDFPVFDCDFGRLGIQICFDLLYEDGWRALAKQGAEIIALPTASPDTVHPSVHALEEHVYIVSAAGRYHAAVYSPLGLIEAGITEPGVLVHEIDLSYKILHWEAVLEEGAALTRKYGDRVGYHYHHDQDVGIFWSNDPATPIGKMVADLGLVDSDANAERVRLLDDRARGGPPRMP
jgi:predicted amidohydrolase